jgi:hypothetical protein
LAKNVYLSKGLARYNAHVRRLNMRTIKALGRYIHDNGGVFKSVAKVARLTLVVLGRSGATGLLAEIRSTLQLRHRQVAAHARQKAIGRVSRTRTIHVLATKHTLFVGYMLAQALESAGFRTTVSSEAPRRFSSELHIVICPQMFKVLPDHMVSFQMEQSTSSRWFTPHYWRILHQSLAVFDYSMSNLEFLVDQGLPYACTFHVPVKPVLGYLPFLKRHGIDVQPGCPSLRSDVLFYGDVRNARRQAILDHLGQHFDVKVIGNLFGPDLYQHILATKLVVNLHYYDDALLETTRICECLSLGVPVVSESSKDLAEYPDLAARVRFAPAGDLDGLVTAIRAILDEQGAPARSLSSPEPTAGTRSFHLDRFLLSAGLIKLDEFSSVHHDVPTLNTAKVCLSLAETVSRRRSFLSRSIDGFEIFDGLRSSHGWVGCGMSYKHLITVAKQRNLARLTICEDDVEINQSGLAALSVVERYLDSTSSPWDVFAGLISNVHEDATILKVDEFEGRQFIHLDKMTGMVLNIYNRSIYDTIMAWDETHQDARTNTIDRYLESLPSLRVVTTLPFLAGHSDDNVSTLWGFANTQYRPLVEQSVRLLTRKVEAFMSRSG